VPKKLQEQVKKAADKAIADEPFVIIYNVLKRYAGPGGEVHIPEGVKNIGDGIFVDRDDITAVFIPSSVQTIGGDAFRRCSGLTSVYIPDSVRFIEGAAFWECYNLKDISVPAGVKIENEFTFMECAGKPVFRQAESAPPAACPACGAETKPNAKFCTKCGAKLAQEPRCAACGAELRPNAKFCTKCGAAVQK
jgi:hypothetical protein